MQDAMGGGEEASSKCITQLRFKAYVDDIKVHVLGRNNEVLHAVPKVVSRLDRRTVESCPSRKKAKNKKSWLISSNEFLGSRILTLM